MKRDIESGMIAGAIGAVILGLFLQLVTRTTPAGAHVTLMTMAAHIARVPSPLMGWLMVIVYGVALGALFGRLAHARALTREVALIGGAFYGVAWWVVSGLFLIPVLMGRMPLSADAVDLLRPAALPSLIGSVIYGVVLGGAFALLTHWLHRGEWPSAGDQRTPRAA